ncbi:MAG TPA: hypothetical protein VFF23_04660, partial [Hanamia sp.]|nr:hypothetical protein [Hanamia sp.]
MRKIFSTLLSIFLLLLVNNYLHAQGCVAIRTTGGSLCTMQHPDETATEAKPDAWQLNISNR